MASVASDVLDPDNPAPPFRQVADLLRHRILDGEYQPGAKLPGRTQLAKTLGVAPMTVQRAVDVLRQEGLIVSRSGQGVFVRKEFGRTSVPAGEIQALIDEVEADPRHQDNDGVRELVTRLRGLLEP